MRVIQLCFWFTKERSRAVWLVASGAPLVDTSGRDVPITVQIVRFDDVAGELETRDRLVEHEPVTIEHDPSSTTH